MLGVWCPLWTAQSTATHQWDLRACPLEMPLWHNSITLGNSCQLPAVVVAQPGHIPVPAMPLTEAKGSVVLVLWLVMVSTGRKMVPVPRLCCSARRSCRSPRPVKPLQSHRVGELQLERSSEGLEGFSSHFGGHKPFSQSDKRCSPVLWGDGPTELLDPSPGAVEC